MIIIGALLATVIPGWLLFAANVISGRADRDHRRMIVDERAAVASIHPHTGDVSHVCYADARYGEQPVLIDPVIGVTTDQDGGW